MKHVQRRHFFVRDMVESSEIEVPFVRTHDNLADFFTKPFKSAAHSFSMRALIMHEPKRVNGDDFPLPDDDKYAAVSKLDALAG